MTTNERYDRPPINETYLAIRTAAAPTSIDLSAANPDPERFEPAGPIRHHGIALQDMPEGMVTQTSDRPVGVAFRDPHGGFVAQALFDGLVFNWVRPSADAFYPGWGKFSDDARNAWEKQRAVLNPEKLMQVSLRYTNELVLPIGGDNSPASLDSLLRTLPDLSRDLPNQLVSGYALQLQLPQPDIKATATMHQALLDSPLPASELHIGLDIVVSRSEDLPDPGDPQALWNLVEELHDREKRIFESTLTQRTRASFGKPPQ